MSGAKSPCRARVLAEQAAHLLGKINYGDVIAAAEEHADNMLPIETEMLRTKCVAQVLERFVAAFEAVLDLCEVLPSDTTTIGKVTP